MPKLTEHSKEMLIRKFIATNTLTVKEETSFTT